MNRVPEAGVLPVSKPPGPTSRKIVDRVARVLGTRRAGHAGTLDPAAEGLLLVAWGKATSIVPYLQEYPKTYRAEICLGKVTDTQDATGKVIAEHDPSGVGSELLLETMSQFRGTIMQTPPMYSAVKHRGRRLYELAREGKQVAVKAREQRIEKLELLAWTPPVATVEVVCSKGTYIRTLAHDLGEAMGCGAHLQRLSRTQVGHFMLSEAFPADEILDLDAETLKRWSVSPAETLPDWPSITVEEDEARTVIFGSWGDPGRRAIEPRGYRVLNTRGDLLALAKGGDDPRLLRVLAERA